MRMHRASSSKADNKSVLPWPAGKEKAKAVCPTAAEIAYVKACARAAAKVIYEDEQITISSCE